MQSSHFLSLITDINSTNILLLKLAIKSFLIFNNWYYLCEYILMLKLIISANTLEKLAIDSHFLSLITDIISTNILILKLALSSHFSSLITDIISANILMLKLAINSFLNNNRCYLCRISWAETIIHKIFC